MRFSMLAVALGLCAAAQAQPQPATPPGPLVAAQSVDPNSNLTLEEAIQIAERASTNVRLREAQLASAEGLQREAASPFFNNPELSTELARRFAVPGTAHSSGADTQPPRDYAPSQGLLRGKPKAVAEQQGKASPGTTAPLHMIGDDDPTLKVG